VSSFGGPILRWTALLLLLVALYAIDFFGLGLNRALLGAPLALLGMAALDAALLGLLLSRLGGTGLRPMMAVFLLFFGVKTALVAVEAAYLPDVLPAAMLPSLVLNGLITAVAATTAAMWVYDRWGAGRPDVKAGWFFSILGWIGRLATAGFLWMLLFVGGGLLVFRPIAMALDPAVAEAYLSAFAPDNPLLILLLQWGRGTLWALLALPALGRLGGAVWRRGLLLGVCFAGWMGGLLLPPNDLLPATLLPAHLVEVVVENLLFGFVLARLFSPRATAQPSA
jgi:hypothetical protein